MVESQKIPGAHLGATAEPQVIRIIVKMPCQKEEFLVRKDMFVRELKEHIVRPLSSSPDRVVLVHAGRILKDHKTLGQHEIHLHSDATIYVVIRANRGHPPQQASAVPASPITERKSTRSSTFTNNGLRELTASLGLNTANFHEFQSQLMSNPDMMLQLLENPFIQSKLSSPDLMKELVTNNPQVQQVIQKAPEISQVFRSPEGMKLMVELARNPAAVREIIKPAPPGNVPGGDNNSTLQGLHTETQGPGQKSNHQRIGTSPLPRSGGSHPSFEPWDKPVRARDGVPSPRVTPLKPKGHRATAGNGESGTLKGEVGQLASAAVKNLLHQIIKHLKKSISPCRNASGQGSSHTPEPVPNVTRRRPKGTGHTREQIPHADVLMASWSPREIQGLLELQQRLQALVTDEPAERPGRAERPARRVCSNTSLYDMTPPASRVGHQASSAQQMLQALMGADFLAGAKSASHLRGAAAQASSSHKRVYKL